MPWRMLALFVLAALPFGLQAEPILLDVDASEVTKRVIHIQETIPVEPGPLTLYYPRWIPGRHRPVGQIANVSGLLVQANKTDLPWKRDDADPFAIKVEVPAGVKEVRLQFDLLLAAGSEGGAAFMTVASPKVMTMNWNDVLFYPKVAKPLELQFRALVRFPEKWRHACAIPSGEGLSGKSGFEQSSLEKFVDSPVLAGENFVDVSIGNPYGKHRVAIVCDSPDGLEATDETKKAWNKLPGEAHALFGPDLPYQRYTFLLGLSNYVPRAGIEHHQSSDNRLAELALIKSAERRMSATLFPHEFVHSWNGKFRRPADMIVNDYQTPHQTRLLWVYEGLTNYLGWVLAARCGLYNLEDAREYLAMTASRMTNSRGRAWRPLDDTAAAANVLFDAPASWRYSRRAVDFYDEGTLLWLEVDVLIRTLSKGTKSIDDFCKAFFGGGAGQPAVKGYVLEDVLQTLNTIASHDWKAHFARRVQVPADQPPLDGITGSGWVITYKDKPSDLFTAQESVSRGVNLADSIGLLLGAEGAVTDIIPEKPAAKAGIAPGMKVIAVNGRRYSPDGLKSAITHRHLKLELLIESGDFFKTVVIENNPGLQYPRLERVAGKPDLLTEILKGKSK